MSIRLFLLGVTHCAAVAVLAAPVLAQVQSLVLQYESNYTQGGPNPPTVTANNKFLAFFTATPPDVADFENIDLTDPFGFTFTMNPNGNGFYQSDQFVYPTRGTLMAAWPAGDYVFNAIGGIHDGQSYTVEQEYGLGLWPDQVPAFTAATYNALDQMDPSQPRTLAVNLFIPSIQATSFVSGYYINRREPNGDYGAFVHAELSTGPVLSSRTIPADTLDEDSDYYVTWLFSHHIDTAPGGGIGYTYVEFAHSTRVPFVTGFSSAGDCPSDLGSQGGEGGPDGELNNNDFIVFISLFFDQDDRADLGEQGGEIGSDGEFNNNDFIAFIELFFQGC